ncbi:MAG: nuclear transport factor 2 family protein [Burkholderiaceae bacterium]
MPSRLAKSLLFATPADCEQAFYEALANADVETVAELWLDDEEVCCIHPGSPRLLGHEAVLASFAAVLESGPIRINATLKRAVEAAGLALHNVIEEVLVTEGHAQRVVHVITTHAFLKTPAGWKMILHHASLAPEGGATELESASPHGTLH